MEMESCATPITGFTAARRTSTSSSPDLDKPIGSLGFVTHSEIVQPTGNSFQNSNTYRGAPPERERALNEALEGEAMI